VAGITPQEFVAKWSTVELTEKAGSQSHFIDLCRLLDQPSPTEADPTGDWYTFEKGATKDPGPTTGKRGWADVWKKSCFAWEYKGTHANLEKAYQQLQQYRESLASMRNCKTLELRFCGLVTEGSVRFDLIRG
jgi:hypothetical protein